MPHETGLIAILAAGFGLAFLMGLVATRFKLPPLVGYLVAAAKLLVIASPDPYHARAIVDVAKKLNPNVEIAARTHSETGQKFLEERGVHRAFMGERELALSMAHHALMRMGRTDDQADATVDAMRRATSTNLKVITRDDITPPAEPPTGPLPQAS